MDMRDLGDPPLSLAVVEGHDLVVPPVKVVGKVSYLLVEAIRGVAYSPPRLAISTSNSPWQWGQVTASRVWPLSLMRR